MNEREALRLNTARERQGGIMKHTAGPWKVEHYNAHPHIEIYGRAEQGSESPQRVAFLQDHLPENEANARLIAAAPELLACCKWLLDYAPTPADAARVRQVIQRAERE